MRDMMQMAGLLGILFVFFWVVIVFLEKILMVRGEDGGKKVGVIGVGKKTIPIIMAGIAAYEEDKKGVFRRAVKKTKDKKFSWWKMSARIR